MSGIADLVDRVRGLTGPDREVDALIAALIDGRTVRENMHPEFGRQLLARNSRPPHDEYWLDHPARVNPPVTASIDAALALAERVLPGQWSELLRWALDMLWHDNAPNMPLARLPKYIVLATLTAIQSSETSNA